jgi:type 1 glutamine amidotransferase
MTLPKALLLLGGNHHNFDGFAAAFGAYFAQDELDIHPTYDGDTLLRLQEDQVDLVVLYTCFGGSVKNGNLAEDLNPEQIDALARWVSGGGPLLAVHSATVMRESNKEMRRLLGGRFVSHPPQFDFTVYPLFKEHPITHGIGAFAVHDEFYVQSYDDGVEIHMAAFDRGIAYPMVWTRSEGRGQVAYLAPGHSERVWDLSAYRQLVRQAVAWLSQKKM